MTRYHWFYRGIIRAWVRDWINLSDDSKYVISSEFSQITVYFGLPTYHDIHQGIIWYLRSPFISVCQGIMASPHIMHRHLFRFAHISWHLSHIARQFIIVVYTDLTFCAYALIIHCCRDIMISLTTYAGFVCWEISQLASWHCPRWQNVRSAHSGHVLVPLRLTSTSAVQTVPGRVRSGKMLS